ncbi:hypothetical protein HYW32_02470 [Candidatus Berkelbacteria bacterium]|nr:hypothetical protein [Candidatus Berkelbacteria bacterium]
MRNLFEVVVMLLLLGAPVHARYPDPAQVKEVFERFAPTVQLMPGFHWYGGRIGGSEEVGAWDDFQALAVNGSIAQFYEADSTSNKLRPRKSARDDRLYLELKFWGDEGYDKYLCPPARQVHAPPSALLNPSALIALAPIEHSEDRSIDRLRKVLYKWRPPTYGSCGAVVGPDGYQMTLVYNMQLGALALLSFRGTIVDWTTKPSFIDGSINYIERANDWLTNGCRSQVYSDQVKKLWLDVLTGRQAPDALGLPKAERSKLTGLIGQPVHRMYMVTRQKQQMLCIQNEGQYNLSIVIMMKGKPVIVSVNYWPYDPRDISNIIISRTYKKLEDALWHLHKLEHNLYKGRFDD